MRHLTASIAGAAMAAMLAPGAYAANICFAFQDLETEF